MKVFVITGEPSGDALGAGLMRALSARLPTRCAFDGIGGPQMAAEGLVSRFPMEELSLCGLAEVVPHLPRLWRRLGQTVQAVCHGRPDVLITIDSPDFGLRVARQVRRRCPDLATVHYVAPTVWAWRPGRAARMARHVEHVLALFPFEPPLMHAAGMGCDFVGHPVAAAPPVPAADRVAMRAALGLSPEAPVVLVLPGSRRGEVMRLGPRFGATMARLQAARPDLRFLVPTVPQVAARVRAMAAGWPGKPLVLDAATQTTAQRRASFAVADAALAASGTVSLELAAAAVPMVIGYDMHPVSRLAARLLIRIDTVTLVNLVSQTRAVPEFLGRDCAPVPMADCLLRLLDDGPERAAQQAAMALTLARLGRGGPAPADRAARSVLDHLATRAAHPAAAAVARPECRAEGP